MIEVIDSADAARLRGKLDLIKRRSVALDAELMGEVAGVVEDVRLRGDAALVELTERFDGVRLAPAEFRVGEEALRQSAARAGGEVLAAIRESIRNVRAFHEREMEGARGWEMEARAGVRTGQRVTPIERAGLYVPGGTAAYPSSVVMNVVPAQVAGVARLVVVTPPRTLAESPAVAAALVELRVAEIYSIGGAQAVAALAYGTDTVPRVDVITGPGNRYVAAAKKLVFGAVGIDSIAGPTEVVIVADETARADFVAADLLAQSEHGEDASAVLITTSAELAARVAAEVARQAGTLPRRAVVAQSLAQFGAIIVVRDLEEACALVNELAPEHLEIVARDEETIAAGVRHAGAIFFGAYTPEAAGDYLAGPNHVLPTGGAARFSSALGVNDFLRRTSLLRYTPAAMERAAPLIDALARAEGLDAHARSALARVSGAGYRVSDLAETTEDSESERGARANATATPRSDLRPDTRHPIPDTRPQPGTPLTPVAASTVKPRVRELRAYTLTPERGAIKINQNENPWELPAAIKREAARRMEGRAWSRYPDFVPAGLHEKLARFAGWTPDGVVAGNGSNELIQATLMVTIGEGRRVLISEPTFALYRQVATVLGGEVLSVPLTPSLGFDAPALVEAVERHQPEVTIICSPNNPTGCRLADEDLRALLAATRGLVVVDEAYFEFAGRTVVPLLQEHPNLVVFRTFSKAMALAALRVGYLLAAPELAREIGKAVLPYNLNAFSQAAAEAAVELYDTELRPLVARIVAERGRLFAGLQSIEGLAPVASQANFMVVRSEIAPRRVFDRLLERGGVLVRDVSGYPMLGNCFRVSVGTPEENDQLLDCLRNIFGEGERGETSDARAAGR